jgi:hypothetical protein
MVVELASTEISGSPYSVIVNENSSSASTSSFVSAPVVSIAGQVYSVTFQSRDAWSNNCIYTTSDSYAITFTQSDGLGSNTLTTTGFHTSAGVYQA